LRKRRASSSAQRADACNGWTLWHVETTRGLRLIDESRAEMAG
jgi:modification methylase